MPEKPVRLVFTLCLLVVSISLMDCKGADAASQKNTLDSVVSERLGNKYDLAYNASKTYVLCQQQREADHNQRNFKYVVVRLSDHQVVREGTFRMGHVQWQDDTSIEVLSFSSIRDEQGEKKIISIQSDQH
jgi:hypothetical protein